MILTDAGRTLIWNVLVGTVMTKDKKKVINEHGSENISPYFRMTWGGEGGEWKKIRVNIFLEKWQLAW